MLPKRLQRKEIYKSDWVNLFVDKVKLPSGKIIDEYHVLDYPKEAVVVLVTDKQGNICMIDSVRYATNRIELELPAGGIEKTEDILDAAHRELFEESGYKAKSLKHVYSFNPNNALSDQSFHIVFGEKDEHQTQSGFDHDEVQDIHWLSLEKIDELIASNKIKDGTTLTAILLYRSKILKQ